MSPPHDTSAVQKPPMGSPEPVRAPGPLGPSTLPESEPARAGLQRVRAMLNAGWPALSFLLIANLSEALSFAASSERSRPSPTQRGVPWYPLRVTRSSPLAKATLPPRVISALDRPPQAPSPPRTPYSPVSLESPTLGLAGGAGLRPRKLACLRALVSTASFWLARYAPAGSRCLKRSRMRVMSLRRSVPPRLAWRALGSGSGATSGMIQ